ncbi:hypothetical protein MHO82_18390 [Vibrio sp. Of7-15]|uniref:hypothetical protein n=1 Tax=Vibrio sp. Of7-15 TaxID=2724879 RepID=UPI001EF2FF69|nr:hypothetical protein [Vibrio sp. Of7-15]MCG7498842.1 hypothetical protein [Vibrio sp. Of7-15]
MITINSDSLEITLDLLKSIDFKQHNVYFNDGTYSYQVNGLNIQYEDFEVNGMFQRLETRFQLLLNGADHLEFYFDRGQIKFSPRKATTPVTDIGMPPEVAPYHF